MPPAEDPSCARTTLRGPLEPPAADAPPVCPTGPQPPTSGAAQRAAKATMPSAAPLTHVLSRPVNLLHFSEKAETRKPNLLHYSYTHTHTRPSVQ